MRASSLSARYERQVFGVVVRKHMAASPSNRATAPADHYAVAGDDVAAPVTIRRTCPNLRRLAAYVRSAGRGGR